MGGGSASAARAGDSTPGPNSSSINLPDGPPTSVLKAVLHVIAAIWAARGSDEAAGGGGGGGSGGGTDSARGTSTAITGSTRNVFFGGGGGGHGASAPVDAKQLQIADDPSDGSSVSLQPPQALAPQYDAGALNIREACAREVGALLRSVVLHTLASRTAPPTLRLDVVECLTSMVAAPQVRGGGRGGGV